MKDIKFLLLQVRNPDDPIRDHEVDCFARAVGCSSIQIVPHDLITAIPSQDLLGSVNAVLIGGSGDYSVVNSGEWFSDAMKLFRRLYECGKPVFASCWGFQALAKSLGGEVVTDLHRAEVGTLEFRLTDAGKTDPVFGSLGTPFLAQSGHQDIVERLPKNAILLCSTQRVPNQAFRMIDKPIYGAQFHPELEMEDLIHRLEAYPEYVENITKMSMRDFVQSCAPTKDVAPLMRRFVNLFCVSV